MAETGLLLIDKPAGITSHDVIDRLRYVTGEKRIGHSGTLDPFATGLLIVGVGRLSTRELDRFLKMDKAYQAVLRLGATSTTGDKTGEIKQSNFELTQIPENKIREVFNKFLGAQTQIPPMYSAKKVAGKKLYDLARRGQTIERAPVSISISSLVLVSYTHPRLTINVHCSSGTYIRTLGEDIGMSLGCGAYVEELTRTAIGPYQLKDAVKLDMITSNTWKTQLLTLMI